MKIFPNFYKVQRYTIFDAEMKTVYAVVLSVVLGGLLGFGLSYSLLTSQFSQMQALLNGFEEQLTSLSSDLQAVKTTASDLNRSLNTRLSSLQSEVSNVEARLNSKLKELEMSLLDDISSLQSQINELQEEWVYVGTWESISDFYTKENFKVEKKILINWYLDGSSWDSYAYIKIYTAEGDVVDAIGVSGWWTTGYMEVPIDEPGYYYLYVDLNKANRFFVNIWSDTSEATSV